MKLYSRIFLAAGHGGTDTGATNGAHTERDQCVRIADRVAALLRDDGYEVIVCPHTQDTHQTMPWVNERQNPGDIAFEIHRDSAESITEKTGASTRFGIYHSGSAQSMAVAGAFINYCRNNGGHATSWSRNHKSSRFKNGLGWINQVKCRSLLVEAAFMEGRNDDAHLDWLAGVIAKGLAAACA